MQKEPTEFEWYAGVSAHVLNKILNLKKAEVDEIKPFYNSDMKWCVVRVIIKEKRIFYLLDYTTKEMKEAGGMIHKDLNSFLITAHGETAVMYRTADEVIELLDNFLE